MNQNFRMILKLYLKLFLEWKKMPIHVHVAALRLAFSHSLRFRNHLTIHFWFKRWWKSTKWENEFLISTRDISTSQLTTLLSVLVVKKIEIRTEQSNEIQIKFSYFSSVFACVLIWLETRNKCSTETFFNDTWKFSHLPIFCLLSRKMPQRTAFSTNSYYCCLIDTSSLVKNSIPTAYSKLVQPHSLV